MHTVFADEPLTVSVIATAFAGDEWSDSFRLDDERNWTSALTWTLTNHAAKQDVPSIPEPRVVRSNRRERGPNAPLARDQDTMSPATSLEARLDFGLLEAGDYQIIVEGFGQRNSMRFFVRTGEEAEVRDEYLHRNALRAKTWEEFRSIQLARYENDPNRKGLVALGQLIDRSLIEGTLEETDRYLAIGLASMERRKAESTDPKTIEDFDRSIAVMRVVRASLPGYFARRPEWKMVRNPATGTFTIIAADGRTVKEFRRKSRATD